VPGGQGNPTVTREGTTRAQRGHYQLARTLAWIFEAEFDDDTLTVFVDDALQALNAGGAMPVLVDARSFTVPVIVSSKELRAGDVGAVVREFSIDRIAAADADRLKLLRGRCRSQYWSIQTAIQRTRYCYGNLEVDRGGCEFF
jgi:hypothetical protein